VPPAKGSRGLLQTSKTLSQRTLTVKPTPHDPSIACSRVPLVEFESGSRLTSFAGLVLFQRLFLALGLVGRLRPCFTHLKPRLYQHGRVVLLLVVHLLLGFRRLAGIEYYRGDPLVRRVVGFSQLPSTSTLTRVLQDMDEPAVVALRGVNRDLVLERLQTEGLARVTLDLDGSVQSTKGRVEGTAVGFNKKRKGARSYWPLYCTVAQTSSILDVLHRPGNVHDSNGAQDFILELVRQLRVGMSRPPIIESRMDGAFFDHKLLSALDDAGVDFTCSVPFRRLADLKRIIEAAEHWTRLNKRWDSAGTDYLPVSWGGLKGKVRFVLYRQRCHKQRKQVLPAGRQLDLFLPDETEYEYKVVVTNRRADSAHALLAFHNGRGAQEKLFGEANQHSALNVIATLGLYGNQVFNLAAAIAHNLSRELQMATTNRSPNRALKRTRPALWRFAELGTLRQRLLHRAGRLTRPQGRDLLTMAANEATKRDFDDFTLNCPQAA
jgi:hypothetical protein